MLLVFLIMCVVFYFSGMLLADTLYGMLNPHKTLSKSYILRVLGWPIAVWSGVFMAVSDLIKGREAEDEK